MLKIVPLVPTWIYWFWEKEPYPLIQFERELGVIGSPKEINEIIEYQLFQPFSPN